MLGPGRGLAPVDGLTNEERVATHHVCSKVPMLKLTQVFGLAKEFSTKILSETPPVELANEIAAERDLIDKVCKELSCSAAGSVSTQRLAAPPWLCGHDFVFRRFGWDTVWSLSIFV